MMRSPVIRNNVRPSVTGLGAGMIGALAETDGALPDYTGLIIAFGVRAIGLLLLVVVNTFDRGWIFDQPK